MYYKTTARPASSVELIETLDDLTMRYSYAGNRRCYLSALTRDNSFGYPLVPIGCIRWFEDIAPLGQLRLPFSDFQPSLLLRIHRSEGGYILECRDRELLYYHPAGDFTYNAIQALEVHERVDDNERQLLYNISTPTLPESEQEWLADSYLQTCIRNATDNALRPYGSHLEVAIRDNLLYDPRSNECYGYVESVATIDYMYERTFEIRLRFFSPPYSHTLMVRYPPPHRAPNLQEMSAEIRVPWWSLGREG